MDNYIIQNQIGQGTFSTVFKGIKKSTQEPVAIKRLKQDFNQFEECLNLKEVKILRKMSHNNIVKLTEIFKHNNQLYMIFEYMDMNLFQLYSSSEETSTESKIKKIIFNIIKALEYIHKHGYFHRDIKPENILWDKNTQTAKLSDFGIAREIRSRPPFTDYVSTRWYRAPEMLLGSRNYNSPVDIFAVGCLFAELYLRKPLWAGTSEIDQMLKIVKTLGTPDKHQWNEGYRLAHQIGFQFPKFEAVNLKSIIQNASPDALELIQSMLQYETNKRPSASTILQHKFFADIKEQVIIGLSQSIGIVGNTHKNKDQEEHKQIQVQTPKFIMFQKSCFIK